MNTSTLLFMGNKASNKANIKIFDTVKLSWGLYNESADVEGGQANLVANQLLSEYHFSGELLWYSCILIANKSLHWKNPGKMLPFWQQLCIIQQWWFAIDCIGGVEIYWMSWRVVGAVASS